MVIATSIQNQNQNQEPGLKYLIDSAGGYFEIWLLPALRHLVDMLAHQKACSVGNLELKWFPEGHFSFSGHNFSVQFKFKFKKAFFQLGIVKANQT